MWVCIYTYVFSPKRYLSNKEHHLTPRSQIFFLEKLLILELEEYKMSLENVVSEIKEGLKE